MSTIFGSSRVILYIPPNYVTTNTAQTIEGTKTLTGPLYFASGSENNSIEEEGTDLYFRSSSLNGSVVFTSTVHNTFEMPAYSNSSDIVPSTSWVQSAISTRTSVNGLYLSGTTSTDNIFVGYHAGQYAILPQNIIAIGNTLFNYQGVNNAIVIGDTTQTQFMQGQLNYNFTSFYNPNSTPFYCTVPDVIPSIIFLKSAAATANIFITIPAPGFQYAGTKFTIRWTGPQPILLNWTIEVANSVNGLQLRMDSPTNALSMNNIFAATFICDGNYWLSMDFLQLL